MDWDTPVWEGDPVEKRSGCLVSLIRPQHTRHFHQNAYKQPKPLQRMASMQCGVSLVFNLASFECANSILHSTLLFPPSVFSRNAAAGWDVDLFRSNEIVKCAVGFRDW